MRYRIWFGSERTGTMVWENSGAVEVAETAQQALEKAHARGIGWGLGVDPTHRAIALADTHYHPDMYGESTAFGVFPCKKCSGSCCDECSFKGICEHCH